MLQAVVGVDQRQWQLPLRALKDRFGDRLNGLKVAVLGLAFKPETGDLTEAPAAKLALALAEEGAELTAYDPSFTNGGNVALSVAMQVTPDALAATSGTQAAVVMTEWGEIVEADWAAAKRLMAPRWFIFDGRNALDHKAMNRWASNTLALGAAPCRMARPADEGDRDASWTTGPHHRRGRIRRGQLGEGPACQRI